MSHPDRVDSLVDDEVREAFTIEGDEPAAAEDVPEPDTPEMIVEDSEEDVNASTVAPDSEDAGSDENQDSEPAPSADEASWEKRYKDLQSHKDQQLAEREAELKAYKELIEGISQPVQEQPAPPPEVSPEDLEQGVKTAPVDTFQWAMMNRPDVIPQVISKIREHHGNELGDEAMVAYNQAVMQYQQQAMLEQQQQMYHQMTAPQQIASMLEGSISAVAEQYGDDFSRLAERTNELMKTNQGDLRSLDPDSVQLFVERNFMTALREDMRKAASAPQGPVESAPADQVEAGTPGAAPELTPDDDIANSIVEAYTKQRVYE